MHAIKANYYNDNTKNKTESPKHYKYINKKKLIRFECQVNMNEIKKNKKITFSIKYLRIKNRIIVVCKVYSHLIYIPKNMKEKQ